MDPQEEEKEARKQESTSLHRVQLAAKLVSLELEVHFIRRQERPEQRYMEEAESKQSKFPMANTTLSSLYVYCTVRRLGEVRLRWNHDT